jgi:WD40 repeat protein
MWAAGRDKPEQVFLGHQSDVKCVDWHPQRALIASGSRDASIRLWDPKMGKCIRYIFYVLITTYLRMFTADDRTTAGSKVGQQ